MLINEHGRAKQQIFWKVIDRHYLSLWDAKDLPFIDKWQEKIRKTHDESLVLEFFNNLDRKWNDHHNNLKVEPLELGVKDDVLTFKGIQRLLSLTTGQSGQEDRFQYVAIGTGAPVDVNPMPFDQALIAEEASVSIANSGFMDATGDVLRYGGTFGSSLGTDNYNESLVRSHPNSGDTSNVALCVSNFQDNPINHTQGSTAFTAAGSIEFIPIADLVA